MPVRLNDQAISAASRQVQEAGKRRDVADATCEGLRLRITPAGSKSWVLACRDRLGRMRRFPLGRYPAMGVSDARVAARSMREKVSDGADPIADRRRDRAIGSDAKAGVGTLRALLDLYGAKGAAGKKSWTDSRKRVEGVFKPLLDLPATKLSAADFQMQADSYDYPSSASFAVRSVRPVLVWAAQRGYVPASLGPAIKQPQPTARRDRVLSRQELAALLPALDSSGRPHATAMLFMLLTLARRDEVASARWRSIDLDAAIWTIPAADSKNKRPHRVPLSTQALQLLTGLEATSPDDFVFCTSGGSALGNWDRETKRLMVSSGTRDWTRHDLRRTGATLLGDLGVEPHVIEAALNHAAIHSALAATYNRSRYEPEVKRALQLLADRLDVIKAGGAEIVPFPSRVG